MEKRLLVISAGIVAVLGLLIGNGLLPLPNLIPLYLVPVFGFNGVVGVAILAFLVWDVWSGRNACLGYFEKMHPLGGVFAVGMTFFLAFWVMTNYIDFSALVGVVVGYLEWNSKKRK